MTGIANVCSKGELRGHIWTSSAFTAAVQRAALEAAGASPIYVDQFDDALRSLRRGNRLVVFGFRGVGRSRAEIENNIARVHARGAAVMDAETGHLSTGKHREELIEAAERALANERRGPRKFTKKDRRMPWDQVAPLYFNPALRNHQLEEAVAVNGYRPMSYHTMWRHFQKPRGAPVGRPSHRI